MPDTFDPYREALVMELQTTWDEQYDDWEKSERTRIEKLLHDDPEEAAHVDYVRTHSGFCRHITVTPEDIQRLS